MSALNPSVSVIVPNYNQAPFIDEALNSILNQNYTDWECIVVDDGSTDDSWEILSKWMHHPSGKFKCIQQENCGVSAARNLAINHAKGKWILPLDADDYLSSNYIEDCLNVFTQNPNASVVYGNVEFIGMKQGKWELPAFDLELLKHTNMVHCSGMFRKIDWENSGGYDINMVYGLEDWEFWISMLKHGGMCVKVDAAILYYRIKEVSRTTILKSAQENDKSMHKYIFSKHQNFIVDDVFQMYLDGLNFRKYQNSNLESCSGSDLLNALLMRIKQRFIRYIYSLLKK